MRLQELEAMDDKRLQAQQQIELYQARITRAFNKKVKEWTFKKGDLNRQKTYGDDAYD